MRRVALSAALASILTLVITGCPKDDPAPGTNGGAPSASTAASPSSAASAGSSSQTAAAVPATTEVAAREFVAALADGKFDDAVKSYDAAMTKALSAAATKAFWNTLVEKNGAYKSIERVVVEKREKFEKAHVVVAFEQRQKELQVVYDAGRIGGLFVDVPWDAPAYVDGAKFSEEHVTVGDLKLPGILSKPTGAGVPAAALVLVHGSGPNDADETDGAAKPFKDLAQGLSSKGIVVLRYVKRTLLHPELFPETKPYTADDETIADARAAVALLKARKDVDPAQVHLLGHSLGGYLAPRIGKAEPTLAGLVILAGAARPLEDLVLEQMKYIGSIPGTPPEQAKAMSELGEATKKAVKNPAMKASDVVEFIGSKGPGSYWLDLRNYKPADVAATLTMPILVLQGERDYQVTLADFAVWAKALASKKTATLKKYPTLNHIFTSGEGPSTPAEYDKPNSHVASDVIDDVAAFVGGHAKK